MAMLRVLGGDFVQHPQSSYFMGEFTLWGWKEGKNQPVRMQINADREVANITLRANSGDVPAAAAGSYGLIQGAIAGAAMGGVLGAIGGAIFGAATTAADVEAHNKKKRNGRQRFLVTFTDGRELEAEMELALVSGLQDRLLRKRSGN
jgi:hypothetical protein